MRYLIMIFDDNSPDPGLVPYTGVIHETKRDALEEFMEACKECGRGKVYLTLY